MGLELLKKCLKVFQQTWSPSVCVMSNEVELLFGFRFSRAIVE